MGSSTAVWGLGPKGQVLHWNTKSWVTIPGTLAQIAVGADGDFWGLTAADSIYHYNSQTQKVDQIAGTLTQIEVGSAGAVYGLNAAGHLSWYNPGTGTFQQITAIALTQISVARDGDIWGVAKDIAYHYNLLTNSFKATKDSIAQVKAGYGVSVFGLSSTGAIYQWNPSSQSWTLMKGTLSEIAAGGNGSAWGLNSSQEIFELTGEKRCHFKPLIRLLEL